MYRPCFHPFVKVFQEPAFSPGPTQFYVRADVACSAFSLHEALLWYSQSLLARSLSQFLLCTQQQCRKVLRWPVLLRHAAIPPFIPQRRKVSWWPLLLCDSNNLFVHSDRGVERGLEREKALQNVYAVCHPRNGEGCVDRIQWRKPSSIGRCLPHSA